MRLRKLGWSDLEVSEISLGSWLTYSGGVEREQARRCVDAAFEAGINFIDTANVYGRGRFGDVPGRGARRTRALLLRARDEGLLPDVRHATAVSPPRRSTSRSTPRLERLQTDYVDLYQCHRYDDEAPLEETMAALSEVVRAGKARHIGFSEWPAERISESLALPGVERWTSSQPQYSMLWRSPEARGDPAVRTGADLPDRVVAARAGGADGQVPPRRRRPRATRAPPARA